MGDPLVDAIREGLEVFEGKGWEMTVTIRYVQVQGGRLHRVLDLDGRRFTVERCNLDDALTRFEVPGESADAVSTLDGSPIYARCEHCWPVQAEG